MPAKVSILSQKRPCPFTLVLLAGVFLSQAVAQAGPGSETLVLAAKASHRCFAVTIHATGIIVPKTVAIAALEPGSLQLDELLVKEGESVTAGQKLARLVAQNGSQAAQPANVASQGMFLTAPAAGRIFKVAIAGAPTALERPEPLIQIAVNDEFELKADIPAAQIPKLEPGQKARIDLGDGRDILGSVRMVPAGVNRLSQLGEARIALEGAQYPPPGTFARVAVDAQRRCGIAIPRSAILTQSELTAVQVIHHNLIITRHIRLGLLSDEAAQVLEGLNQGELVVAHAGSSLHDGDAVTPSIMETNP